MRVRLTRKLAESVDGIDLRRCRVGDIIELSRHDGELLLAEHWAEPFKTLPILSCSATDGARQLTAWVRTVAEAADRSPGRAKTTEELRERREEEGTKITHRARAAAG